MNWKQEIDQYLLQRREEIVQKLCELVQIPSVAVPGGDGYPYGAGCARALDFCAELCAEKGLAVTNHEYRCVEAKLSPEQSGRRLVVVSHADVVPADEENIYPPFGGAVHNGYVIGRGVVDDKGPLIATLYALAFIKEKQISIKNDIRLVFGSNEESGMDDVTYYLEKVGQPDWGLAVDDDFPTTNGEKGLIRFTLSFKKNDAIASIRTQGVAQRLIHDSCEIRYGDGRAESIRAAAGENLPVRIVTENSGFLADGSREAFLKKLCLDGVADMLNLDRQDDVSGRTLLRLYQIQTEGRT